MGAGSDRGAHPPSPAERPPDRRTGRLDIVATPIGNLKDLSPRARDALAGADLIAAEDTRRTAALLSALGLSKPLISLHEHNELERLAALLERLAGGQRIALVSDAGTPLVSDPGHAFVHAAIAAGYDISAIPGPSAVLMALTLSGLPADRFAFEGFLPARAGARLERLRGLASETRTLVLFEAPHRIVELIADLVLVFGPDRRAAVARELSKTFETVYRGSLARLASISGEDVNFARGEITLVVEGAASEATADELLARRLVALLIPELPPARVAAIVSQFTGIARATVYGWITSNRGPR